MLKLYGKASGGTVLHTQEEFIVRGRLVNTASWSWQQLSVGKLATVDLGLAVRAEVYVENLAGVPVWTGHPRLMADGQPVPIVVREGHRRRAVYGPWGL